MDAEDKTASYIKLNCFHFSTVISLPPGRAPPSPRLVRICDLGHPVWTSVREETSLASSLNYVWSPYTFGQPHSFNYPSKERSHFVFFLRFLAAIWICKSTIGKTDFLFLPAHALSKQSIARAQLPFLGPACIHVPRESTGFVNASPQSPSIRVSLHMSSCMTITVPSLLQFHHRNSSQTP